MSRVASLMFAIALVTGACSGGSDGDSAPASADPVATDTVADTEPEATTTTEAATTTTTSTTVAPTTTLDEAALLAEAEAAYLEAFEVGKEVIRNPDNPDNQDLLREHFTDAGLESVREALQLTIDGNFVAVANETNPSLTTVVERAEFVDGDTSLARMTVCEFNSDRIFEQGTAPDGTDALIRDDPVSILFVIRMQMVEGTWKLQDATRGEEIRSEEEQCSDEA